MNVKHVQTWYRRASHKRITRHTSSTTAYRIVIDDLTQGINTTSSWTRVSTLELVAGSVRGTLIVDYTLGPTVGWGANVLRRTRAHCLTIVVSANTVGATRRWVAWVNNCSLSYCKHTTQILLTQN